MNATEQLENAHMLVIQTVDNLPELEWDMPMSAGGWTVKDTIAHLASYTHLLAEMCHMVLKDATPTPYITQFIEQGAEFNQMQVAARSSHTGQQVIDEFEEVEADASGLLAQIPAETIEKNGAIAGHGERSLSDSVSALSAHIQRHCDEITAFRNREKQ